MKSALILIALLIAAPAWANDCAKYSNYLAYNACLASHGPRARGIPVGPIPAGRAAPVRAPRVAHGRRRHVYARHRRGRISMTFSVGK